MNKDSPIDLLKDLQISLDPNIKPGEKLSKNTIILLSILIKKEVE